MGLIHADIELINGEDIVLARRHLIDKDEIRAIKVRALVDTGSLYMTINEHIQQVLQLPVIGKKTAQLANGNIVECDVVSPLEIRFKNRDALCRAMVLPEDSEPLLGAIPMEEMDVLIHPQRQELIVNPEHPDFAIVSLRTIPKVF